MEQGCVWHFKREGGIDNGPNDSIHQIFHGNSYYYIVRESIQNSLDAVDNPKKPVKVVFSFKDIDLSSFPEFLKIEEHIEACKQYFSDNPSGDLLFDRMLAYITSCKESGKITCLEISDYNTKGMLYEKGNKNCSFYAFLRAAGVSAKSNQGSGGSFGFGKGAYFALSPLKILMVSSKDTNDNVYFEGGVRLTTHTSPHDSEEILSHCGYYDNNAGEPVTDKDRIPEIFHRSDPGTDIYIMGLYPEVSREDLMIKSVLNNFWLAIHNRDLEVEINGHLINSNNMEETMNKYFVDDKEKTSVNEIISWNPRPYYKAVKYAGSTNDFLIIEDTLNTIGSVKLYLYLDNNLPNRVAYFRKAEMVVYKQTYNIVTGYVGVFLCDDEKGNEILRLLENPAHNEWNIKNCPLQKDGQENPVARQALDELNNFVKSNLKKLSDSSVKRKTTFMDLEEYLSIPEDLINENEELEEDGGTSTEKSGIAIAEESSQETGNQSTKTGSITKPKNIKATLKPKVKQVEVGAQEDGGEDYLSPGGSGNESSGGNQAGADGVGTTGNNNSLDKRLKKLIKIRFKQVAQIEDGICFHYLIINCGESINSAEIELFVGADGDDEEKIPIIHTNQGKIERDNCIKGVSLTPGNNIIKIRFSDNIKHSLKVQTYEVQG